MSGQTADDPWVWDVGKKLYRRYDLTQERWIFQDEDRVQYSAAASHGSPPREQQARNERPHRGRDSAVGLEGNLSQLTVNEDITTIGKKNFKRVPWHYFQPGTVFQCILNQERGPRKVGDDLVSPRESDILSIQTSDPPDPGITNRYHQPIHSELRIFVVLWDNQDYSASCLSVQTFGGQGVAKRGLNGYNYSIIHSDEEPPDPQPQEWRGPKYPMRRPIKVDVDRRIDRLDPKSRINLRAVHCVQMNWRVYLRGKVSEESWPVLWELHREVTRDSWGPIAGPSEGTSQRSGLRRLSSAAQRPDHDTVVEEEDDVDPAAAYPEVTSQRRPKRRTKSSHHKAAGYASTYDAPSTAPDSYHGLGPQYPMRGVPPSGFDPYQGPDYQRGQDPARGGYGPPQGYYPHGQ